MELSFRSADSCYDAIVAAFNIVKDVVIKEESYIESEEVIAQISCGPTAPWSCVLEARKQKPKSNYVLGVICDCSIPITSGLVTIVSKICYESAKLVIEIGMSDGSIRWITWQKKA